MARGSWPLSEPKSLVILGNPRLRRPRAMLALRYSFSSTCCGVWGWRLYGIFIVLFCYRIFFFDVHPADVTPALWVVMGAAAISTNAGSTLILADTGIPFLHAMRPFIDGITLIVWAWATWWIPLLLLFGIWKHGVCRIPLTYTPLFWSIVFPLGMYSLASMRLSLATDFPPLRAISAAWCGSRLWRGSPRRPDSLPRPGAAFASSVGRSNSRRLPIENCALQREQHVVLRPRAVASAARCSRRQSTRASFRRAQREMLSRFPRRSN